MRFDPRKIGLMLLWRVLPLAALVGLIAGAVQASGRVPAEDAPHILGISMRLGWLMSELRLGEALGNWLSLVAPHPPGAYLPTALLYALLGPSDQVPLLAALGWLLVLRNGGLRILEAQGLERRVWVLDLGLAASVLVWRQIDNNGVDLASAAMAAQCLGWLAASRGLRLRRASVLAGLWLGLGFWVKYTFPIVLFLPCVVVAVWVLVDRVRLREEGWTRVVNGLLLCGGLALTLGPLALVSGDNILGYVALSTEATSETVASLGATEGPSVSAFDKRFFYLAVLKDLWGWPGLALLVVGFLVGLWEQRRQLMTTAVVASAALGGVLVLSSLTMKGDRYALPVVLPVLVVALPALARRWLIPTAPLVLALPLLFIWRDYSGWTHGQAIEDVRAWGEVPAAERRAPSGRGFEHSAEVQLRTWGAWPRVEDPYRPFTIHLDGWALEEVIAELARRQPDPEGLVGLCLTERTGTPGFGVYLMEAERQGLHWNFVTVMVLNGSGPDGGPRTFQFYGPFQQGDDVVVQPPVMFVSYNNNNPQKRYLDSLGGLGPRRFELSGLTGVVVELRP
jgi:hypothetical protein